MKVALSCIVICCVLLVSACGPAKPKEVKGTAEELDGMARNLVLSMAAGKYDEAAKEFTTQMVAALPSSKLGELWSGLVLQGGTWQGIEGTRFAEESGYRVVYVTAVFEKGSIDIKVVFDREAKVAGLWLGAFRPSEASTGYVSPPYVVEDSFTEREVVVGEGQWALPGTLTIPKGEGPFPAVVLVHGSGPLDRDETIGPNKPFRDLSWGLASRGIAVLRYEKRTKHYPVEVMNLKNITVKEETVDDAVAAVTLLAKTPGIDPARVFVLGHSLGAMLAPRIAKECGELRGVRVAGMVLMAAPSRNILDVVLGQVEYLAGLDGFLSDAERKQVEEIRASVRRMKSGQVAENESFLNSPASYWKDLMSYDGVQVAMELNLPVLVLQGERDYQVTMEDFCGWKERLLSEDAPVSRERIMLKSYADLNHLFMSGSGKSTPDEYGVPGHLAQEVVEDIVRWVKSTTGQGR